jgi:ADP-ribose pyrophosphatase YjhB (NUDIX family)
MENMYKIGLVVIQDNKVLLCRPHAYQDLIMPGGLVREGESFKENILRQAKEELGDNVTVDLDNVKYLGNFKDIAAGKPGRTIEIELYQSTVKGNIVPSSEIKECVWFSITDDYSQLSPIIKNQILPYLQAEGLLQ